MSVKISDPSYLLLPESQVVSMRYNLTMIPKLIIHPEIEKREQHIQKLIANLGFETNHPDLMWFGQDEKLGIEQAKKIKNFLKLKPFKAQGQMIVITSAEKLTTDAQNALLKTLEEHASGVNLVLGTPAEDILLPTLISRCEVIHLHGEDKEIDPKKLEKLYKQIENLETAAVAERFKFIEKLEDKESFLQALIQYYRKKLHSKKSNDSDIIFLKDLLNAERFIQSNVNIRAISEYLMLRMPRK